MTTIRHLFLASTLALLFGACATTDPAPGEGGTSTGPRVAWMFDGHIADGSPSFDVYLEVNGTPHMVVNNAETVYRELEPGEGEHWGVPADRLTACTSWWAGHGDVIYVLNREGTLTIHRSLLEEQTENTPFRLIKTIRY